MKRRKFLELGALASSCVLIHARETRAAAPNLEEISISDLQAAMSAGSTNSRQITQAYIDRIQQIDPQIKSVVEVNHDALEIAARLDAERESGKLRGPLHGIPVLIKDNIDTADKMKTTAGSLALVNAPTPNEDAFVAAKLRQAGAVILGKTNLSEWANYRSTSSSSGWSGRGGQTRNPYILDRTPCGSSSGSGTAIAANLAAVAVGTETNGSIICPSANNALVGIKPTLGLISRSGIIPIAASQDTAGPMARTVADAAILLGAMVGTDANDAITSQATKGLTDYSKFLKADGLKGKRIGVARNYFGSASKIDTIMESSLKVLESCGAQLVDIQVPMTGLADSSSQVLSFEFKDGVNKYLTRRGGSIKSLADLIEFNEKHADLEMKYFKQELLLSSQAKENLESRTYRLAILQAKTISQDAIDGAMDKDKLDAITGPSNGPAWLIDLVSGDGGSRNSYVSTTTPAAVSGYPNITVPAAFLSELPIGISFWGRAFSEPVLIEIAFAFEQAAQARRKPKFLPSYL